MDKQALDHTFSETVAEVAYRLQKAAQEAPGKNHRVASVLSEAKAVASKLKPGPWHIGEAPNPAPGSRSLNTYTKK